MPPSLVASRLAPGLRRQYRTRQLSSSAAAAHLPRIVQPSLWSSIVPKFLRRQHPSSEITDTTSTTTTAATNRPSSRFRRWIRNPSTSLIVIALLTGSQAIQVLQLRNDIEERRRLARRRLDQLNNVLRRIKDGEKVDLAAELGTGDPAAEQEWKDVMDQIADEDFWLLPKNPHPLQKKKLPSDAPSSSSSTGQAEGQSVKMSSNAGRESARTEEVPRRRAFY